MDFDQFLPATLTGGCRLRPLGPNDCDRMMDYFAGLGEVSRGFFHPHPFDRENAERICRDDDAGTFRLVAESEGRVIGYAWFSRASEGHATVGIGIADAYQGRGLGRSLMEALTAEARRRQLPGLRLTVYEDNERAVELYSSCGYRVVGREGRQHVMDLVLEGKE